MLTCLEQLVPMYEKFGFRNLGESASVWGGERRYEMDMELDSLNRRFSLKTGMKNFAEEEVSAIPTEPVVPERYQVYFCSRTARRPLRVSRRMPS